MTDPHDAHHERQRAHFDTSTLTNPRMVPSDSAYVAGHVQRVVDHAGLRPGATILDVGCGLGKFSLPLRAAGYDVVGLDLSADLLDALADGLEQRGESAMELHCADLAAPPAELHGRFDAVTGFFMLHHLPDLPAAFAGVRTCLKADGTATFLEPNAYSPLFPVQITLTPGMSWKADRGVLAMRRSRLVTALGGAGFSAIRHRWTGLVPPAIANAAGGRGIGIDAVADRIPFLAPVRSFQVLTGRAV